jgi:hypothetical protein
VIRAAGAPPPDAVPPDVVPPAVERPEPGHTELGLPGGSPGSTITPGPPRPRRAGEPEPLQPAEVLGSQAHRARSTPTGRPETWRLAERLAMAAAALVITAFFAAVGVISFAGGDLLQGMMAALGALLSGWVGLLTVRGRR